MASEEPIVGPVAFRLLPAIVASLLVAFFVERVIESPYAWITFDALVAFLATIAAAVSAYRSRQFPTWSNRLFDAGLMFIIWRHLSSAIEGFLLVYGAGILESRELFPEGLIEIALIGVIFLASEVANLRSQRRLSQRTQVFFSVVVLVGLLILHMLLIYWILLQLEPWFVWVTGIGFGTIGLGAFLAAGVLSLRASGARTRSDVARYLTIYLLYGLVCVVLLLATVYPFPLWSIAFTFQVTALIFVIIAVMFPIVNRLHLNRRTTNVFILIIAILILLPFFFVLIGQWLIPSVRFYSFEVFLLSHIGAAILSGGMVILLYAYSQRQPLRIHSPLLSLYATWTVVEFCLIVASLARVPITINQTLVPYVTGCFVSIILLAIVVRQLRQPQTMQKATRWRVWIWYVAAVILTIILGGEILQLSLHSTTPSAVVGNPLDRMILMGFNIVLMFLFTLVGFLMLERFQSRITVEMLAVGYLALWILPSLLRSITLQWTLGWWVGEFLLLSGLLFGPVILGIAYLEVLKQADSLRRQASLYSDLLIHDIGNYHQIIQSSIDLLETQGVPPETEERAIRHARAGLLRAHYLVRNVRQLAKIIETQEGICVPVDLVESIEYAYSQALLVTQAKDVEFRIDCPEGRCFVVATDLLKDLFFNLLRNSIEYSPKKKRILVEISQAESMQKTWWVTKVTDHGRGIDPALKTQLFERFLEGAQGTGLGLSVVWALAKAFGGSITVEDRVPGDHTQGSVFIVTLQATEVPASEGEC